jgi:3-oxoacyl-(acyl-carrier-protein) synthase
MNWLDRACLRSNRLNEARGQEPADDPSDTQMTDLPEGDKRSLGLSLVVDIVSSPMASHTAIRHRTRGAWQSAGAHCAASADRISQ